MELKPGSSQCWRVNKNTKNPFQGTGVVSLLTTPNNGNVCKYFFS